MMGFGWVQMMLLCLLQHGYESIMNESGGFILVPPFNLSVMLLN